jgi:hypothetical protein
MIVLALIMNKAAGIPLPETSATTKASDFARSVKENFETIFADSMQVKNTQQLKHSKLVVLMEKFEMS